MSKITCFTDEKTSPCVRSKRPRVFRHHEHMCFNMCAWCRYTRWRFERTHGDVLSGHTEFRSVSHTNTHINTHNTHNTTKHNTSHTQHHTEKETETDRDRERRQGPGEERRRKRREKTREEKTKEDTTRQEKRENSFLEWWCMAVFCWCSDLSG